MISALSLFTVIMYLKAGSFSLSDALVYLPGGVAGAAAGAILLKRLPVQWIRLLFCVLILYSAVRLWMK